MLFGVLQFIELLKYGNIHFFLLFFIWVWFVWGIKMRHASRHRSYENNHDATVAVIIPTFNEDPELFRSGLESVMDSNPQEILVVFDGPDPELESIADAMPRVIQIQLPKIGKRAAFVAGVSSSSSEILVLKDSDTVFAPGSLQELIKPFADPEVGGVTSSQRIFDADGNWIRRICDWMEDQRFLISTPAQSNSGVVGCLPGRAIAFRREIVVAHLGEFLDEKFLGQRCETGDDRALTNFTLRDGYKTVLQERAIVYTDAPNTLSKFMSQQLRWARSSQRYTIMALPWIFGKPAILPFHFLTDMFTPFLFLAVVVIALLNILFDLNPMIIIAGTPWVSLWWGLVLGLIGMNLSLGLRQLPHLLRKPSDIFWLPLYTLVMTFVLVPIRIIGFFTMSDQGWMTRKSGQA